MLRNILAIAAMAVAPALAADDTIVRAMKDELERSMRKLRLENLQKPYFIAYRMVDVSSCSATASFGALTSSACEMVPQVRRTLSVEVRVGDYARDNTNFYAVLQRPSGVAAVFPSSGMPAPVDDNYDELRRLLWLATDSAYKEALDVYAKKMGALQNRTRTDDAPDFSKEAVATDTETAPPVSLTRTPAETTVKELSALFRQSPGISNSEVTFGASNWLTRYVNSEGTSFTRQTPSLSLVASAVAQAVDGMPLTDFEAIYARSMQEIPPREEIVKRIADLQSRLQNLRQAPLVNRYTGPVLFEGQAAGELMAQGFASALVGIPRIVVDDPRFEKIFESYDGSLIDKLGGRVLPEFMSVTDNPAAREFQGKPLLGGFQVDEDGVKARPIVLVEKGQLKTLLRSRALIPGVSESTASRRGSVPSPTNLLFTSEKTMPAADLRAELLRLVKQRGKEYGIVVRRVGNSLALQSLNMGRGIVFTSGGRGNLPIDTLVAAYKVYPDGREELVRNLEINGLTLASFRDILAVSDTPLVYTEPFRVRRMSPITSGFSSAGLPPVLSVAVPSLLFDELTLQRPTGEIPNPPITKHPFFDR